MWFRIIDLYTLRHPIPSPANFEAKMLEHITTEELIELESCLAPLESRMDKVIIEYILASRSHAAVTPRGDSGADEVFEDSYDMRLVIELLNYFKRLIDTHGGLPQLSIEEGELIH